MITIIKNGEKVQYRQDEQVNKTNHTKTGGEVSGRCIVMMDSYF